MTTQARRSGLAWATATMLFLLGPAAFSQTTPPEIWVAGECQGKISIIDPTTDTVTQTVDVSDPDGNLIVDPPSCLAFSSDGNFAFVVQGRFVTPVVVTSRTVQAPFDIASLLGATAGITLSGCSAAVPRRFNDVVGPVVKSYLYVAGTLGTGEAVGVVLDQAILTAGTPPGNPLVTSVVLSAAASARGVVVLPNPSGSKHQRAWFTLVDGTDLVSQESYLAEQVGAPLQLGEVQTVPLPVAGAPPDPVLPSAPLGGEFVVVPQGSSGPLQNPLIGGECSLTGEPTVVSVTGFGNNSYTVAVLDASTDDFRIVDPSNCAVTSPISVGSDPVAMSTLGPLRWERAYVANHGSDSVTAIGNDQSSTTIDLCPAGGDCNSCPVAVATARPTCDVERVHVEKLDMDGNGMIDTYRVDWVPVGCQPGTVFEVACQCATVDDDCPCSCDCGEVNPPQECQCPGFPLMARSPSTRGLPNNLPLLPADDDVPVPENPWIVVGQTPNQQLDHDVPEGINSDWDYRVEPN